MLAAGLVVVAGCGGDDGAGVRDDGTASGSGSSSGSGSGSGTETTEAPPVSIDGQTNNHGSGAVEGGEIDVELDDFYIGPTFIQAEAGATITVHLTNEGDSTHTFTIDEADVDEELAPGDTRDVEVTVPDADSTVVYCRFHQSSGMQGALFTTAG